MDSLTLDQIHLFLAVVEQGSFSKAAHALNRAQSSITYGIQKLEAQIGIKLFDRTAYRPVLTEAGRALVIRAHRIAAETGGFREAARGMARGLEAELTIVVSSLFPMAVVVDALAAFTTHFPTVPPRVFVEPLGAVVDLLLDGTCMIGLLPLVIAENTRLKSFPLLSVDLIPVAAPHHPLAHIDGRIETHELNQHVQLVLTDRSPRTAGPDHGVLSGRTWRLADLSAKQSMLVAGLGWGNMPFHLVEEDLARGRLTVLHPVEYHARAAQLAMGCAYLLDQRLGPAGRWLVDHLSATIGAPNQS